MTFENLMKSLSTISPVLFPKGMAIWFKKDDAVTPKSRTCSALMWQDMGDTEGWEIWLPLTHDNLWDCIENNLSKSWIIVLSDDNLIEVPKDYQLHEYNPHWPF